MKLLYLDLVGGISGDMTVAALIDLGVPLAVLQEAVRQAGLAGVVLRTERAERHHLAGTRFIVDDLHAKAHAHADGHSHAPAEGHAHTHAEAHGHAHSDGHAHAHAHAEGHGHHHGHDSGHGHPHRTYRDIVRMLEQGGLAAGVRARALAIFAKLAEAEGAVHGVPPADVTFHEVGAWDSIADVVCAAAGIEYLQPEAIYCSPVPVGSGMVSTAHGRMPVPAPATLRLLAGFSIVQGGPAYERTTPTGAAILAALASPAPEPFAYVPRQVGLGIGTKDTPEVPNVLRAVLGDTAAATPSAAASGSVEAIECAEANLDDANPEWIGYLMERLLEAGALDVALVPIHMKKSRPGTLVQVLYRPELRETVQALLFSETTTLGVRYHRLERVALPREALSVNTRWGAVRGKVARQGDQARFSPEYEDCRRVARAESVPLREVYLAAQQAWQEHER